MCCYVETLKFKETSIEITEVRYYHNACESTPLYPVNKKLRWSSDKQFIAAVNPDSGEVYPVSNGTAVITVVDEYSGVSASYAAKVQLPVPICCLELKEHDITLKKNAKHTLKFKTILPDNATTDTFNWYSSNEYVATVNDKGVVTAKNGGTAIITVYAMDESAATDACYVQVTEGVECVTINSSGKEMTIGDIGKLEAIVCPPNANDRSVIWESSNTNAVIVDCCGNIEAVGVGEADIKAISNFDNSKKSVCHITVKDGIRVTSVSVGPYDPCIKIDETEDLGANVHPYNATNQRVVWSSSNEKIALVNNQGKVTAVNSGTVTIRCTSVNGGHSDSIRIKVVKDNVTIKKDGNSNMVVFETTGKVWRCINYDMIFDEDNMNNTFLIQRSNHNFFTYYNEDDPLMSNTTPKEYNVEEIKLLYTIDPYGVAYYIQRYVAELNGSLEDKVKYKDRIFRMLFNREPKYFARTIDGTWYEVDDYEEINDVLSESETYFGMHTIYDWNTFFEILGVCSSILNMVFLTNFFTSTIAGAIIRKTVKTGLLIVSGMESVLRSEFGSYVAGNAFEKAMEKTSLEWALSFVSLYDSLDDLADAMNIDLNYNKQIIDYCACQTGYNVLFELKDGTIHNLNNVCGMLD